MNVLPDVQSEECDSLFGRYTRYFIMSKNGRSTITIEKDGDYKKIPYHLNYENEIKKYGKATFEVDIPNEGLAVTKACNGFGSGTSLSFIITKVEKERSKLKFTGVKVYIIEDDMAWVNMNEDYEFELCRGKSGLWKLCGQEGLPLIYYVRFGHIEEVDIGFDK